MYNLNDILLDRYKIFGYREGGMGIVYFLKDMLTGRNFAAKTYKPGIEHKEHLIQKFHDELKFSLEMEEHQNLLTVHFIQEIAGHLYLFTDYIDGGEKGSTLAERIEHEEIDLDSAISFGYQISKGMDFLNRRGPVAHLDLKPGNILIDQDDIVKISDFGLARDVEPFRYRPGTENMRSWPYMSPEQFKGEFVDTRADIYAFGIIFYEMLTGKLPYDFEIEGKSKDQIYQFFNRFHTQQNLGETLYWKGIPKAPHLNTLKSSIGNMGNPSRYRGNDLGVIIGGCIDKDRYRRFYRFDYIVGAFEFAFSDFLRGKKILRTKDISIPKQEDHFQRGLDFQKLDQHSKALRKFNKALKEQPGDPMIWFAAAVSLWNLDMYSEAEDFLQKALSLAPENILFQRKLKEVQKKLKGG
jgi:serine/threonine protein kinase